MSQLRYVYLRVLHTVFLLWLILTFLFVFFRLMPGSYTDIMVFGGASQETVQAFVERWGLNEPLHVQYWTFLTNYLSGDFGISMQDGQPVWDVVKHRIFNTLILVAPGITVGYIIASILGTILGNARGKSIESAGIIAVILTGSVPAFFLAIVMITIFSGWLNVLPSAGLYSPGLSAEFVDKPWWRIYLTKDFGLHYILPFSTIVIRYLYVPTTTMRTSVVEVIGQDFNYYHMITGLPYLRRLRHVGKHAILPVLTIYPISMARALSGLVLVEIVFSWPGIGFTLVDAVLARNTPVVQFVFFITAAFVVIGNFGVDILYTTIDPRINLTDK